MTIDMMFVGTNEIPNGDGPMTIQQMQYTAYNLQFEIEQARREYMVFQRTTIDDRAATFARDVAEKMRTAILAMEQVQEALGHAESLRKLEMGLIRKEIAQWSLKKTLFKSAKKAH